VAVVAERRRGRGVAHGCGDVGDGAPLVDEERGVGVPTVVRDGPDAGQRAGWVPDAASPVSKVDVATPGGQGPPARRLRRCRDAGARDPRREAQ
jgi:hypothetical protein